MKRFKILSWQGLLFCLIATIVLALPGHSAWAQDTNNGVTGAQSQYFQGFYNTFQYVGALFLLVAIVIAGILWAAGKPQYAIGVILAAVLIFGTKLILGLVGGGLNNPSDSIVQSTGDQTTIEGAVSNAISSIESTIQGFAIMLCAIYGTLLGIDSLLGGLDSARLTAFIVGTILVCSCPALSAVFQLIFTG